MFHFNSADVTFGESVTGSDGALLHLNNPTNDQQISVKQTNQTPTQQIQYHTFLF